MTNKEVTEEDATNEDGTRYRTATINKTGLRTRERVNNRPIRSKTVDGDEISAADATNEDRTRYLTHTINKTGVRMRTKSE